MAAYIEHAAYYTARLAWHLDFFAEVYDMHPYRERTNPDGCREVWLTGGVQLCETAQAQSLDGRCAHLCLIVEGLEEVREKALAFGCSPMKKHHWVKTPEGLSIEMFEAAEGAVAALEAVPKRAK